MGKLVNIIFLSISLLHLLTIYPENGDCANILFYHNLASYSHRVPTYELALALAKKGHQVTLISPFRPREPIERHPNLTDITPVLVEEFVASWLRSDFDINHRVNKLFPRNVFSFFNPALETCQVFLSTPELKDFLDTTKSLDLLISDNCMTECGAAIAYKYGAKQIYFSTTSMIPLEYDFWGWHAPESGSVPEVEIDSPKLPMTLLEKVRNFLIPIHFRYEHYKYITKLDGILRKHFGLDLEGMPFLDDVARNHSLVLYGGDVVTDYPRSLPPNVINVAGIHCKNMSGGLTKEMENFINDDNSDGFVYMSTGSLAVSSFLPDHIKKELFATIASFPKLKFLWKWNGDVPQNNVPTNVFFSKWFPQQEILGHPRIRAFVTQGGRPSTVEAVFHGVPMISFPVLGDQDYNADRMEMVGGSVKLELGTVTKEEFVQALNKVVYDPTSMERAKELQTIFRDRPQSPLETAVWWTEYVLRNKDLRLLKPAGFDQTWYQRRLLDVYTFLFLLIVMVVFTISCVILVALRVLARLLMILGDKSKRD